MKFDAVIFDAEVLDFAYANVRPRMCAGDDGVICCAGNRDGERRSSAGSDSLVSHTGFFSHHPAFVRQLFNRS